MNMSGDAAEQIVRMSLQGVEVAARISGTAAKEIALLIIAALKSENKGHLKLKGKERLSSMLKSGKPLEIHSIRERDLERFSKAAKEYGIVYCILKNTKGSPDGLCDIMVKADDAPKIARLVDRFKIGTVDRAKIEREITQSMEKSLETPQTVEAVQELQDGGHAAMDVGDTEKLLDDLLGADEGKTEPDLPEPKKEQVREPMQPKTATDKAKQPKATKPDSTKEDFSYRPLPHEGTGSRSSQSVPTSELSSNSAKDSSMPSNLPHNNPPAKSVREELREISESRKAKEKQQISRDRTATEKTRRNGTAAHMQPQPGRKPKTKSKGR